MEHHNIDHLSLKEQGYIKEKLHEYYKIFYIHGGLKMTPYLYHLDNNIDTFSIPFDMIHLSEIQDVIESYSIEKAENFLYEMLRFSYSYRKSLEFTIWMIFVMNSNHILNYLRIYKVNFFVLELIHFINSKNEIQEDSESYESGF